MLVVLTGASRGLGRALVEGLVARGHTVAGCARSATAVNELRVGYASPHRFDVVDVADPTAVQRWGAAVLESHGPPELLLNNAALINANAPLWEVPVAEFSQVVDTNVKGVFYTMRVFLPAMIRAGRGVVVNFSSGWGRVTAPDVAPYCATKWAIEGLTQAVAQELPDGLAAVPLNPGIIHTDMLQSCFGDGAAGFPTPAAWAERAVPYLLQLSVKDNGRALTVPGV
jgi:NAD(P)-dependent dehydrogenase (short-subunit alcohol dehydrogenase family)